MARTTTASFGHNDWNKALAILGALAALGFLPKKWGTPIAVAGLLIALRD
ncbi:MAG: hypothetical protein ACYDCH_00805 [Gaiellaceae bacterium]